MAKACSRLTSGIEAGGSGTTVNTASVSPGANSAVIVAVVAFDATSMSVSGLGLTWTTKVNGFQYNGASHRIWVFSAYGSPSAGVLALTYNDGAFLAWVVDNITGTVSSSPTNANTATGSGTSTSPLATLGAFAHSSSGTWGYCVAQDSALTFTAGSGFTEILERAGLFDWPDATEFRDSNDTTVDGTLSGSIEWGMVALEIVDTASAASGILRQMMMNH